MPPPSTIEVQNYRPLTWRRRLLILLLAVATAITVVLTLLYPPRGVKRVPPPPPDAARCADGRTTECVGGKADVILQPAASTPR